MEPPDLTNILILFPLLVSAISIIAAVVTVTSFLMKNGYKIRELERTHASDQRAHEEGLKIVHARLDAEVTRLRLELERLRAENQQQEERSRKRDEALSEKIAALNIAVVAIQTEMKIRKGNGEGGGE